MCKNYDTIIPNYTQKQVILCDHVGLAGRQKCPDLGSPDKGSKGVCRLYLGTTVCLYSDVSTGDAFIPVRVIVSKIVVVTHLCRSLA